MPHGMILALAFLAVAQAAEPAPCATARGVPCYTLRLAISD
jgi:hypothetical protein